MTQASKPQALLMAATSVCLALGWWSTPTPAGACSQWCVSRGWMYAELVEFELMSGDPDTAVEPDWVAMHIGGRDGHYGRHEVTILTTTEPVVLEVWRW